MAYKMKGPSLYQNGALGKNLKVQKDYAGQADGRATSSPLQMSIADTAYKPPLQMPPSAGTPNDPNAQQPNTPVMQRVTKGGEGADENKIFDKSGNHVGDYVNGKKVMHTKAQHAKIVKKK